MYIIKDENGVILEESISPKWLKQQRVDFPINADSYEEADGVTLSDGNTMCGIVGRNMQNYTPLVVVEEVSSEPYIMKELEKARAQVNALKEQNATSKDETQALMLDIMSGLADLFDAVSVKEGAE